MEKVYLKTDYDKCDYITAGKLYEATVAQTVKDDGVNYDAYYIVADSGMEIYAYIDGVIPHLHNEGNFYLVKENTGANYVRPAMTPEARDILNSIHETVGAETRSDSIVEFMNKHTEMEVELCARKQEINELEFKCGAWKDKFFRTKKHLADSELAALEWKSKFVAEKLKHKGWIIYSAIVAAYALGVSVYCLIQ